MVRWSWFAAAGISAWVAGAELPGVLPAQSEGVAPKEMMRQYWLKQAVRATDACDAAREALSTAAQVADYQARIRASFLEALGGFPERAPLEAKVTGAVRREGYRIEKILFESQPQFYVTGLLYVPDALSAPVPGVLVPCGHSAGGKDQDAYQWACIQLAKSGMVALIYDPVDQGERMQLLDAQGKARVGGTAAHSRLGVGSILLGRSTATFRIWDGMRALDYLASRPEVDASRLGCTGNSGGGTLTSYLMALDPRIRVAAPSCYITDLRHVIERIGPQDAEQNIFGQLAFGMDHAEYLTLRAPSPTLVCCASKDFFAVDGAHATYAKARRIYGLLGAAERVSLCEADEKHGFSAPLRAGAVGWMKRWLLNDTSPVPEVAGEPLLHGEAAWCTPKGQVMLLPGARSAYDLNRALNERLAASRAAAWSASREAGMAGVRKLTGIRPLAALPPCAVEKAGTRPGEGCTVDACLLRPEPGIVLPALVFVPEKPTGEVCLYVHGAGKAADADGPIAERVKRGETVMAVDLRGLGETQGGVLGDRDDKLGLEWKDAFVAYLLGTSYLAKRAEDVLVCARAAAAYGGAAPRKVKLVAVGFL
jgi:dienelactone hydrolase